MRSPTKRLLLLFTVLLALALPAVASAHDAGWRATTINGSPWSNTFVSASSQTFGLNCWQNQGIFTGATYYLENTQNQTNYGLMEFWSEKIDGITIEHRHPFPSANDVITGAETRQYSTSTATLGTRRVFVVSGTTNFPMVKFVNQSGNHIIFVRANC